jgi:hypothetical protein
MGLDWKRLRDLDALNTGNQYGFVAQVLGAAAQIAGGQVIRFNGDRTDINPWRVYLSPWRPKNGIVTRDADVAIAEDFAFPTLFNALAEVSQTSFWQFYAQINFGSGGVRQTAFVDWPVGGLLCQVSASYLEVNAIAVFNTDVAVSDPTQLDPSKLPDLAATLAEEPGGGDAARAATYSYPFQALDWAHIAPDPTTGNVGINFPVPPFARKVSFVFDNEGPVLDAANYATQAIIRYRNPDDTAREQGVYFYNFNAADELDSVVLEQAVPPQCAYVRVEFKFPAHAVPVAGVGATFELDL